jgi:hypothetical protein
LPQIENNVKSIESREAALARVQHYCASLKEASSDDTARGKKASLK